MSSLSLKGLCRNVSQLDPTRPTLARTLPGYASLRLRLRSAISRDFGSLGLPFGSSLLKGEVQRKLEGPRGKVFGQSSKEPTLTWTFPLVHSYSKGHAAQIGGTPRKSSHLCLGRRTLSSNHAVYEDDHCADTFVWDVILGPRQRIRKANRPPSLRARAITLSCGAFCASFRARALTIPSAARPPAHISPLLISEPWVAILFWDDWLHRPRQRGPRPA